ncbi:hypothetical protein GA0115237_111140 [Streptomyces sp. ScaeMP-6W]|nr:hypothetical protein MTP06_20840 [Streptomyces sp. PLM4]SCE26853.1 hypothetical protein GA0115237_111140 [Streptomyces sp. ScaeMP-6W]
MPKPVRMKDFRKYWGWVVFAVLVLGWLTLSFGPVTLLLLSGASAFYCFFNVPLVCGAEVRNGLSCRNNCYGALMGCHLRQHRWQKFKMLFWRAQWGRLRRELFQRVNTVLATLGGVLAVTSGVAATLQPLLGGGW